MCSRPSRMEPAALWCAPCWGLCCGLYCSLYCGLYCGLCCGLWCGLRPMVRPVLWPGAHGERRNCSAGSGSGGCGGTRMPTLRVVRLPVPMAKILRLMAVTSQSKSLA